MLILAAVGSVIAPLSLWRRSEEAIREQNILIRRQAEQASQVAEENESLSNKVAEARAADALTDAQKSELRRLRGEIGRLREASAEANKLRAAIGNMAAPGYGEASTKPQ